MRIFRYIRPYRFKFGLGIFLLFFSSVFTLTITRLLGQLAGVGLDTIRGNDTQSQLWEMTGISFDMGSLNQISLVLVVLLLVQGGLSFLRVLLFAQVTESAMLELRNDTYKKALLMPLQFFNERRVGDLSSRISSDITTIQETLTTTLAEFVRQIIIIVGGIAALVIFSWKLTLIMLATLPVMMIVAVLFGRYIRKLSKATQDKVAESNVIVQETYSGIVNVKSFTNEAFESSRYLDATSAIRKLGMKNAIWRGLFGTFIIIFIFGALGFIIKSAGELVQAGELNAELFMSFA